MPIDEENFVAQDPVTLVTCPVREIRAFQKTFQDYLYTRAKLPHCRAIQESPLKKQLVMTERLIRNPELKQYAQDHQIEFAKGHVELAYENYNLGEVLQKILPKGVEVPGGFEAVGHIAHLNLSNAQMPFKRQIGQAIIDKNPAISTVVTKLGHIESTFRFYELECIAGSPNYEAIVVEDKVRFKVDVSKMYWCSKLSTERSRLIKDYFRPGHVLCDMFCGVGPLAVKAAVKCPSLKVLANDLNPMGVEYLKKNISLNKVQSRVLPFNLDAREFVRMLVDRNT